MGLSGRNDWHEVMGVWNMSAPSKEEQSDSREKGHYSRQSYPPRINKLTAVMGGSRLSKSEEPPETPFVTPMPLSSVTAFAKLTDEIKEGALSTIDFTQEGKVPVAKNIEPALLVDALCRRVDMEVSGKNDPHVGDEIDLDALKKVLTLDDVYTAASIRDERVRIARWQAACEVLLHRPRSSAETKRNPAPGSSGVLYRAVHDTSYRDAVFDDVACEIKRLDCSALHKTGREMGTAASLRDLWRSTLPDRYRNRSDTPVFLYSMANICALGRMPLKKDELLLLHAGSIEDRFGTIKGEGGANTTHGWLKTVYLASTFEDNALVHASEDRRRFGRHFVVTPTMSGPAALASQTVKRVDPYCFPLGDDLIALPGFPVKDVHRELMRILIDPEKPAIINPKKGMGTLYADAMTLVEQYVLSRADLPIEDANAIKDSAFAQELPTHYLSASNIGALKEWAVEQKDVKPEARKPHNIAALPSIAFIAHILQKIEARAREIYEILAKEQK